MDVIVDLLNNPYGDLLQRIVETVAIIVGLLLLRRLTLRTVDRRIQNTEIVYTWRKSSEMVVLVVGGILLFMIWFGGTGMRSATTYLGLLSAGLAIALQDPLTNLIGWLFIVSRRPFEVGHRIEMGDVTGDVIDIQFFQTSMLEVGNRVEAEQSTGRVVRVPNRFVFTYPVANYMSGFPLIWNEIPVDVTFESDWQVAKELLSDIAKMHSLEPSAEESAEILRNAKKSNIRPPRMTPIVYTSVAPSGVVLTLRYLCKPRQRRSSEHKIWEAILETFAERNDVDFAYPTQRVFYHPREGKTLSADHSEVARPRDPSLLRE